MAAPEIAAAEIAAAEIAAWGLGLGIALVGVASWAATGAVLRLLIAWRIYDKPNHRSSHRSATPRGGGLALVPLVILAWSLSAVALGGGSVAFWSTIAGALLLAAISWADDRQSRPAALRFGVQVVAVTLGLWSLDPAALVFQGLLPLPADRLLTALLWLWFVNLFNFMDGIDGLSAVETASIGGGLALVGSLLAWPPQEVFAAAALAAAALGFVYWNWAPSRIFLGDVGSVPLGYLLGWLLITVAADGFWAVAVILPLYYLADASLTLARRALRGGRFWRPHREHFYQRAVDRGFGHAAVAGRVLLCNLVLLGLALLAALGRPALVPGIAPSATPWIAVALALLAVAVLLAMLARSAPPRPQD